MSLVLQPQANFTVVRQIANHTDSNTYYVQAVIRNAYTDTILDTLNLEDRGSQRFKKDWQVPADASGQGFYVSIVTSVYTDSNYTTKSANYGDEENTYLVQERVLANNGGGTSIRGGGGLGMSDVRRIMREELEKLEFPEQKEVEMPEMKEYDEQLEMIVAEIGSIKNAIKEIPTEAVNLVPLATRIDAVAQEIRNKEVTPQTDLTPVLEAIRDAEDTQEINHQDLRSMLNILATDLSAEIKAIENFIPDAIGNASFTIPIQAGQKPQPQEQKPAFNVNQLAQ